MASFQDVEVPKDATI